MKVTLSDTERQFIALFEDVTGATARDCVVDEDLDRVLLLVGAGEMGQAIGPGGKHVREVQEKLGRQIELIEDADTPEAFVANALAPAAVYHVTISHNDDIVAYAEVAQEDAGVAIGKEGRNIAAARLFAKRHHDIDDIQLT